MSSQRIGRRKATCARGVVAILVAALAWSCGPRRPMTAPAAGPAEPTPSTPARPPNPYEGTLSPLTYPGERHLANVRQLTFGGENAEAYWSADGRELIFQSTRPPYDCDQIYLVEVDAPGAATDRGPTSASPGPPEPRLVSTGAGRTTCAYFFPDGKRILYASTHLGGKECPKPPDRSKGYVWALFPSYDIFTANRDGSDLRRLTTTPGYDAEATISTNGSRIVFTSVRDGDLEVYSMAPDGSDVKRLTHTPGYDGGAFFSDDGDWIVYRASRPTGSALEDYRSLLRENVVRPTTLDIHVMRADGSDDREVTHNGAANFAPFFFRGQGATSARPGRIIFCSNLADPRGRNFDLFAIDSDGTNLERITYNPTFDGFPMFSPDGRRLAFCSNRHNAKPGETNVFVADWVP